MYSLFLIHDSEKVSSAMLKCNNENSEFFQCVSFCIHFVQRIPKGRNLAVLDLEASSSRNNVVTGEYMQHLHC
jgi:hypothetical protein